MASAATPASRDPFAAKRRVRHAHWFAALALVVALVPLTGGGRAHGDPIDDKRVQAKELQDQIDANGVKIDALSEQYNGAEYHLEQARAAIADAQQKLDATRAEVARLKALVDERGAALYRGIGQGGPINLDVSSAAAAIASSKYSSVAAEQDTELLDQLHHAEATLRDQQAQAEQAQADAQGEENQITKAKADVDAANTQQEQLLSQVNGEIAQLVAQDQARKEAEALAAAQARFVAAAADAPRSTTPPNTRGGTNPAGGNAPTGNAPAGNAPAGNAPAGNAPAGNAPARNTPARNTPAPSAPAGNAPVSGGAGAAIAYARAELGKPYCYAGAGPSCFDCSGLTMRAWGAAGVSMPHYSGAQYSMFPHVPLNAMQPGDLVFWGPGGSQHVGLYIGGGQMIAAPHTGDVVKIQAVWGSPVGAARPG
jgi:cell wall-associated NlpC family hydrolase